MRSFPKMPVPRRQDKKPRCNNKDIPRQSTPQVSAKDPVVVECQRELMEICNRALVI